MQNSLQYYVRSYDKLQDVLSDIGGISSIVITIADFLNSLIYNFVILLDTEDLIINRDIANYGREESRKRPTILRKVLEIKNPPKKSKLSKKSLFSLMRKQDYSSTNSQDLIQDGIEIFKFNENSSKNKTIYIKRNNSLLSNYNSKLKNNIQNIKENTKLFRRSKTINSKISSSFRESNVKINNYYNLKNDKTEKKIYNLENMPLIKQNFNWFKYICYLICCRKNDKKISFYENLRASLISEENIIQSYLDVYQLLKINNIQKKSIILT